MYSVERITLGPLSANCYFISSHKPAKLMIIDPGDDGQFLSDKILRMQLTPECMIATHGHFDHIMGAGIVSLNYGIPLSMHSNDYSLAKKAAQSAKFFLGHEHPDPQPVFIKTVLDAQYYSDTFHFRVLEFPGHTQGGVGIYFENDHYIFCGDLIFADGFVGRTDFSYSNKNDLNHSISLLLELPKHTIVFPGHGDSCTIADIRQAYQISGNRG